MVDFQGLAGVKWVLLFALLVSTISNSASANPPENCLFYAYTQDSNHNFLLDDNSTLYGSDLRIIHNCENLDVYVDGFFKIGSGQNMTLDISQGYHNFTFEFDNMTVEHNDVLFIPSSLSWYEEYTIFQENQRGIPLDEVKTQLNYTALITGVLVWALSVGVYWRLINNYVDRNYLEEVN